MDLSHRRWYVVAALIALFSWAAGTAYAASAWDPVRTAAVAPIGQDLNPAGKDLAIFTDVLQPDRNVQCFARADGPRIKVPAAPVEISVDSDGTRWHLIAVLRSAPDGVHVACAPRDKAIDTARYGTAIVDLSSRLGTAKLMSWGGFAVGLTLATATLYARTRKEFAND